MKKITCVCLTVLLVSLCGCEHNTEQSETRFVLDTVATLTANCDKETLNGAFELCSSLEDQLSATKENSDVYRLNSTEGFTEIEEKTLEIIERSLYYSDISGGKFDITVYPVSMLWDFKNQIIPSKAEISEALKNVDYNSIQINGKTVNLNGKKIDLGGIAKGYIADELASFLKNNGANEGIVNLGGNVVVFGKEKKVGIQTPFEDSVSAVLSVKDKSVVTSGIYQRYIKNGEKIYHHIIDTDTGYGVENELASVTVIGNSSLDCDAFSTVCMLLGLEEGLSLIEATPDAEAVFIDRRGNLTFSDGIYKKNNVLYIK